MQIYIRSTESISQNINQINTYQITMDTNTKCCNVACQLPRKINSTHCKIHSAKSRCPNCVDWIDSRHGQRKYDGHCATCFKYLFPTDPRTTIRKSHNYELQVRQFLATHYPFFVHNAPIYTHQCDCTNRRRIDHYTLLGNTVLAVETDEHQHRYYVDDQIRYNDLYMHFSGKWIFIRFNVHAYLDSNTKYRLTSLKVRLRRLQEEIDKQLDIIRRDSHDLFTVTYLYYNGFGPH